MTFWSTFLVEQAALVERWLLEPLVPLLVVVLLLLARCRPSWADLGDDALFALLGALVYTPFVLGCLAFQHEWEGRWALPAFANVVAVIVLGDAIAWGSHRLRHTVWLWAFHAVHHAPRRLTPLTTKRVHPIDLLVDLCFSRGLALALLPVPLENWPLVFAIDAAWDYWIHGEWRPALGPLERWIVTPGYHHLHHSRRPEHAHCNYADRLVIWDRLAGCARFDFTRAEPGLLEGPEPRADAGPLLRHIHALILPFRRARRAGTDAPSQPPAAARPERREIARASSS